MDRENDRLQSTAALEEQITSLIHDVERYIKAGSEEAARADALEEEIKRLREALRPFAEEADQVDSCEAHPNGCPAHYSAGWCADLTIGDFRRARTALEGRGS
ncbi:hypothetical protein [Sphingobium sp. CFD-2]|uniref:hypothetical protein n=1 Tax=Sphingobium sp. CFD-2 TaxID=2878542 RepID=UPI00214BFE3E|nr:hypothetical protein [Sphingobium sp. CFD-2]